MFPIPTPQKMNFLVLMRTMEIFVVRHGETVILEGQNNPDTPLNSVGIEQAKKVGQYFAKLAPFDAVYASPLLRTRQTVENILPKGKVIFDDRLKEGDHGNLELEKNKEQFDILRDEYSRKYPDPVDYEEHFEEFNATLLASGYTFETTAQFEQRVRGFYKFLRTQNHKRVLIVTHRGFISTSLCSLFRIKLSPAARKTITNCCIFGMRETYDSYTMTTPWFNV